MKMKKHTVLSALFILAIAGCVSKNQHAYFQSPNDITPYPGTIAFYQTKANEAQGEEALQYQLKEVGRLLHDGMRERAKQQLQAMPALPASLNDEKRLLIAKTHLLSHSPEKALKVLGQVSVPDEMELDLRRYYHSLLAEAYQTQAKYLNAISERIELDALLVEPGTQMVNRREIWHTLSRIPLEKEEALLLEAEPDLAPWLSLNLIARQYRDDGPGMFEALKIWQNRHKHDIANSILQGRNTTGEKSLLNAPKRIALLLPLSGPLKGPGQAVRDGFMASYYGVRGVRPRVRFYDTNQKNVVSLYQEALSEGAEFVVGPLSKHNVDALAHIELKVPTIGLNESGRGMPKQFYQFALSPQDEAMQVANKAYDMGLRRALVIAPAGHWGMPIAKTFVSEWGGRGGHIASELYYDDKTNMAQSIKALLHITPSEQRDKALSTLLNKPIKFIPRRRQDVDMIFLLAYPSKARQIRPLLRYYYAGNIPIYATSSIYAGKPNPHLDVDLNDITFAEMPWLLNHPTEMIKKNWPEQLNSYNRLHAIGRDSFLLSQQLNQLLLFPLMGLNDNTGTLYIDNDRKIRRQMSWGKFNQGIPYRLT